MAPFTVTFDPQTCNYRAHATGCGAIGKLVILGQYETLEACETAFYDDAIEKGQTGQYAVCKCCRDVERAPPLIFRKSKPL